MYIVLKFQFLLGMSTMMRLRNVATGIIFTIAVLSIYCNVLNHSFLINWDDTLYVTANVNIRGFTPENIRAIFTSYYGGNYAPIQMLSYMLDYSIWGLNAHGYLLTNILIHIANGWLFYTLLKKHFATTENIALMAALIFLCHPVQVESVAWISQRKNLLSATLLLLSLITYIRYTTASGPKARNHYFYGISLVLFLLSLLTKSVTVILLPIALLFDVCHAHHKKVRTVILDKIPYLIITLTAALITLLGQNPFSGGGISSTYHGGSGSATALTMTTVLSRYLKLLFFPSGLSPMYDVPIKTSVLDVQVIFSLLIILALCTIGVWLFKKRRDLFFWYGFFFIAMLPVSQIVPIVTLMNDRYLYLPLLGFSVFISGCAAFIAHQCPNKMAGNVLKSFVVIIIICLGATSHLQSRIWHDSMTLWERAVQNFPQSSATWTGLATSYHAHNKPSAALQAYLRAVNINPANNIALNNLALMYLTFNKQEKAEQYALHLIRTNPDYALGFSTLGTCYITRNEVDLAELSANKALSLNPRLSAAWNLKGEIYLRKKKYEDAIGYFEKGYENDRYATDMYHYYLATVEAARGNMRTALNHLNFAYKEGLSTPPEAVRSNLNFDTLRKYPEFETIVTEGYGRNRHLPLIFK